MTENAFGGRRSPCQFYQKGKEKVEVIKRPEDGTTNRKVKGGGGQYSSKRIVSTEPYEEWGKKPNKKNLGP